MLIVLVRHIEVVIIGVHLRILLSKKKKTHFDENANLVDWRNIYCQKTEVSLNRKLLIVDEQFPINDSYYV